MAPKKTQQIFSKALKAHLAGQVDTAAVLYKKLLTIKPGHVAALNNLGAIRLACADHRAAAECFEQVLKQDPANADALNNLGLILKSRNRLDQAADYFKKALKSAPANANLHTNLGAIYKLCGQYELAEKYHQKALAIDSNNVKALNNLGLVYKEIFQWDKAVEAFKKAIGLNPDDEELYFNLGEILVSAGRLDQAVAVAQKALDLFPGALTTACGAARVFIECGHWEEADRLIGAIAQFPFSSAQLALLRHLMLFINASALDRQTITRLHFTCGALIESFHEQNRDNLPFIFDDRFQQNGKLRIGYVSPDFNHHSVGYFFYEILKHHDPRRFEVYCYAISTKSDDLTDRISRLAAAFRPAHAMSDYDLAQSIYNDRIQILVDLAGYTRNNRLDVFALKPAPSQVTAIGYPHGSGLSTMDYRLTDDLAEGPGADDCYREKLIRLDPFFLPLPNFKAAVKTPVRAELGLFEDAFVFASFNAWHKLRPEVLRLWNRILQRIKKAQILFSFKHADQPYAQARVRSCFDVAPERLVFSSQTATQEDHRSRYALIDAALDPFPYSGTTTSWEALSMGVPVVTLKGGPHVQRTTYSMLVHLGLDMLVASDENEYLEIASRLVLKNGYLEKIRAHLSESVGRAIKKGNQGYVRQLEEAYLTMWAVHQKQG